MRLLHLAVLCCLSCLLTAAEQQTISAQDYARALRAIASSEAGAAADLAEELAERQWRADPEGPALACDRALLEDLVLNGPSADRRAALAALADEVTSTNGTASQDIDRQAFEELVAAQRSWRPSEGGDIAGPIASPGILEAIGNVALDSLRWMGDQLGDFFRWLKDWFFPSSGDDDAGSSDGGISLGVWLLIALAVVLCAILVVGGIRRRKAPQFVGKPSSGPAAWDEAGERPQGEWERMASELLAAGRRREALRAFYNACLAACFARGVLVYRRGRTNWEYLALLSRDLPWHDDFTDLTRHFDIIWYGHHEADENNLSAARRLVAAILQQLKRERAA